MGQERWDIKLRFLNGPLRFRDVVPARGPMVRLGTNPGPGELELAGYRGLDARQAVITVYDGDRIGIAPVGSNQVRVATHQNVDWTDLLPIQKTVFLSPGSVVHLGPPNRGCTFVFVEAQRLGAWQSKPISTLPEHPEEGGTIDTTRGRPRWFLPSMLAVALLSTVGIIAKQFDPLKPTPRKLGPVVDGDAVYTRVDTNDFTTLDLSDLDFEGLDQAFLAWVMRPNAEEAGRKELEDPANWDERFKRFFTISVAAHARAWSFWSRLESREAEYRLVVEQLRASGLPEVFAAIPYQESGYQAEAGSDVCALGWWQFMPEVALRAGLRVQSCHMGRPTTETWTPTELVPVRGVLRNARYVRNTGDSVSCRITDCEVDERVLLEESTRGAIKLLSEAWNDPKLKESGALVQLVILSHNAGYHDAPHSTDGKPRQTNILPAYERHLLKVDKDHDPHIYGQNITCLGEQYHDIMLTNKRCEGVLANQTQHYAYSIVAQHVLAACYFARNHGQHDTWKPYRDLVVGDGYCTSLSIPTAEEVLKRSGNRLGGR